MDRKRHSSPQRVKRLNNYWETLVGDCNAAIFRGMPLTKEKRQGEPRVWSLIWDQIPKKGLFERPQLVTHSQQKTEDELSTTIFQECLQNVKRTDFTCADTYQTGYVKLCVWYFVDTWALVTTVEGVREKSRLFGVVADRGSCCIYNIFLFRVSGATLFFRA